MILHLWDIAGEEVGTVGTDQGHVVTTGTLRPDEFIRLTVIEPGTLRVLSPADGDRWIIALAQEFRSEHAMGVLRDA